MNTFWIVAIAGFLLICFLLWMFTNGPMKSEYGEKMWRQGSSRLSYWQAVIYLSFGITTLIVFILKWLGVVTVF